MINVSLDPGGMHRATNAFLAKVDERLAEGLEATLESIAARAKQTTTFTDRTTLLRTSIQSDGVSGSIGGESMTGVVSFAARSERGYLYGVAQEYGTRTGVREKRFIRDAIDQEFGPFLEDALASAFRDAGFEVGR